MAKPAITLRSSTAPSPLTYAQLDQNFTNLKDATISLDAGTGGTTVTTDLNGKITLVAGSNVTLTGDNTAKTITITATGGSGLTIDGTSGDYELAADIDLNGYVIRSNGTNIQMGDDAQFGNGSGPMSSGELRVRGTGSINIETATLKFTSATTGTPSNTTTPTAYLQVTVNGNTRYIPLYT